VAFFEIMAIPHSDPALKAKVLQTIEQQVSGLSFSGHGAILSTLTLKALQDVPDMLGPNLVNGILDALDQLNPQSDSPKRYFGISDYHNLSREDKNCPPYQEKRDLIENSFSALDVVYPTINDGGRIHICAGEKLHSVTFAHALFSLEQMGYVALWEA